MSVGILILLNDDTDYDTVVVWSSLNDLLRSTILPSSLPTPSGLATSYRLKSIVAPMRTLRRHRRKQQHLNLFPV